MVRIFFCIATKFITVVVIPEDCYEGTVNVRSEADNGSLEKRVLVVTLVTERGFLGGLFFIWCKDFHYISTRLKMVLNEQRRFPNKIRRQV